MLSQTKSTTLLDKAQVYKDELIVPIRLELTRPDGSVRVGFAWFAVDADANVIEDREECISLDGAFEVAKRHIDLSEARINFGF